MDDARDLRTWLEMICGAASIPIERHDMTDCELAAAIYGRIVKQKAAAREVSRSIAKYLNEQ